MDCILQLVKRAERNVRLIQDDRRRCQMIYPDTTGVSFSERCRLKAEYRCAECGLALCKDCVEVVAFDPYCPACASEQKVFIAALIEGLNDIR